MERRLAAILAADVVGYSRLMGADEERTLVRLKTHRDEITDPAIAKHKGRIVKLMGDGMLAEFASVVDAVRCAVDIQEAMREHCADLPEEQRIRLRIGINLGDVIIDGEDIYGDGVNIAARLEGLAEVGGICVSRTVFDHVRGKVEVGFEDLGTQTVKNIPEPVQTFKVLLDAPTTEDTIVAVPAAKRTSRWPMVAGSLVFLVIVSGALLWQRPWEERLEPASVERMVFPLPDRPSIAVLPFNNMSNDPNQDYFADGMTEDLITDLSNISGLFVISRNSSFTYKGQAVQVRQVAEELGVRYVLEGSVRRVGDQVRINAQLIDATTGGHLWAERYDGTLADVFDLQDRVTKRIVDDLALELTPKEAQRVSGIGTESVEAHDAYLLGLSFYYRRTPESFAKARTHFEQAIELDPGYSTAHVALAKLYAQAVSLTYSRALKINNWDATAWARKALAEAGTDLNSDMHVVRSWLALNKYQHSRAISEAERALELNPNDVDALEALARARIYAGEPRSGIELAQSAMRQNPTLQARPFMLMGLAEFALGNPGNAVAHIERAFELGSQEITYAGIQASAYGKLGRIEQAQAAFTIFREGFGGAPDLARSVESFPFLDRGVLARLAEGLELAGVKVWFTREDGGYLPLLASNRLSGAEIKRLLSGSKIEGKRFWYTDRWQRVETSEGNVAYSGTDIQAGIPQDEIGTSRIEDDLICEQWPETPDAPELCSAIFRVPDGNARTRWGDYVLATDTGPHPFRLSE
jgi:adenylate cyclase